MRVLRNRLSGERSDAPEAAAAAAPIELWSASSPVSGYLATRGEFDPAPLLARLIDRGACLVLPVVVARRSPLVFREARPVEELTADAAGMAAPPAASPVRVPRLIFAPLLAFDRRGGRLGQGGGYYDRTIALLRRRGPITVVGVAFADQEVDATPSGPLDQPLDAILTETGYRTF
jgi:5-formyltetrahydrofolate cyclo-ligase